MSRNHHNDGLNKLRTFRVVVAILGQILTLKPGLLQTTFLPQTRALSLLLFHANDLIGCSCLLFSVPSETRVCQIPWRNYMWVLRTKFWSFGKVASAQIHWAISPAFLSIFLHTHVCVWEREKGRFPSLSLSIYSFEIRFPMKPKVYFLLSVLEVSMPWSFS